MVDGRSVIKQGQIDILVVLYKYRFGSRQLIAEALQINPVTLHKKLFVLVKHGLINTRQEKRSKLYGIPAAYYLTPKGLRYLQSLEGYSYITESVVKGCYRDKVVSETTVLHCFDVLSQILALKRTYPGLKAYLRREMSRFTYFPKTLPDAFLSLSDGTTTRRFFFDYVNDTQERKAFFQRVSTYIEFFDIGGWNVTNTETPVLLFVAEKGATEHRIKRLVKGAISKVEPNDDPIVCTTTKRSIDHIDTEAAIWTNIDDPDELLTLEQAG